MVQPAVFERLLTIVLELAVDGKQGRPLGAVFVYDGIQVSHGIGIGSCRSAEPKPLAGIFPQISLHLGQCFAQTPGLQEAAQKQFPFAVLLVEFRFAAGAGTAPVTHNLIQEIVYFLFFHIHGEPLLFLTVSPPVIGQASDYFALGQPYAGRTERQNGRHIKYGDNPTFGFHIPVISVGGITSCPALTKPES
jgi:hypothetical protein